MLKIFLIILLNFSLSSTYTSLSLSLSLSFCCSLLSYSLSLLASSLTTTNFTLFLSHMPPSRPFLQPRCQSHTLPINFFGLLLWVFFLLLWVDFDGLWWLILVGCDGFGVVLIQGLVIVARGGWLILGCDYDGRWQLVDLGGDGGSNSVGWIVGILF